LNNLKRYGFAGPIHLINPRRAEIFGQPCYADFKSLPEVPDHMVVLVPAAGVIETLKAGAAAGARSATVFSAGFGEGFDAEAAARGRELAQVIAATGLGVSGPNCMGNICAASRLVTFTEERPLTIERGPVALVGQSGGMMIFTNLALQERGVFPGLSHHQRQRGRALGRRLRRLLRRSAAAQGHHHLCRGGVGPRQVQGRLPHGTRRRQVDRRGQARSSPRRAHRRHGAYRLARGTDRGLRRGR
jgi:predicted CoA-binding protein